MAIADTRSTANAIPAVDQATPTDTTTAQSTEEAVQLAATPPVPVSSPGPGAEQTIRVEAGQTY